MNYNTETFTVLKQAIQDHIPISYELTSFEGTRKGNPHAIFIREKTGDVYVHIWQTHPANEIGWKQVRLDSLETVKLLEDEPTFKVALGYKTTFYSNPIVAM